MFLKKYMNLTTVKWNIQDYHQIISTGILANRHVELINGEIVEMSPEGEYHAYSSDEAGEYLIYLLGEKAKVRQAKPITIPETNSEPEPDISIVQRLGKDYQKHHPYPENIFWVIEYSSSSLNKDLEIKTKVYASAGIPEYWIINLQTMELMVFRDPTDAGYQSREIFKNGEIQSLAFPDVDISVNKLLGM
jgi:Uma2 family endonuclease